MVNISPIPTTAGEGGPMITKDAAVALLHDHNFFLHCDPHYVSHRALPPQNPDANANANPETAKKEYQLPRDLDPLGSPAVKLYEVVDHVPNPVWSSSVVSKEEVVNFKDGLWVRIRSPLSVVMETRWSIKEAEEGEEGEGLQLVEEVDLSCSKLLISMVKAQVENNWKGIHGKIVDRLVADAKKKAAESK